MICGFCDVSNHVQYQIPENSPWVILAQLAEFTQIVSMHDSGDWKHPTQITAKHS